MCFCERFSTATFFSDKCSQEEIVLIWNCNVKVKVEIPVKGDSTNFYYDTAQEYLDYLLASK